MPTRYWPSLVLLAASCLTVACGAESEPRPGGADSLGPASGSETAASEGGTAGPSSSSSASSASPSSSSSAEGTGPSPADDTSGTTGSTPTSSEATGPASTLCDVAGQALIVPSQCDGPSGNTTTEIPPNGLYATSWFGCYMQDDGSIYQDPSDNCEFACGSQGLCPGGQDGPTCEANLQWFAANADRYGCGGRIRVKNCDNDKSVVLVTLDRGPNCNSVEMACDAPVLDMSHDAMVFLFDGATYGGCEHQAVVVEQVDPATPLGPE